MAHYQHRLATSRDLGGTPHRPIDPVEDGGCLLAAWRSLPDVEPRAPSITMIGQALLAGEALEDPETSLAKIAIDHHLVGDAQRRGDDARRLVGPREIAGHDDVDADLSQSLCQPSCLPPTDLVEPHVGVPLETTNGIPIGLTVPHQKDGLRPPRGGLGWVHGSKRSPPERRRPAADRDLLSRGCEE